MIGDISGATSIYIITGKTDMHKSINGTLDYILCPELLCTYAGYNKLKDFNRCYCYAHIRRYFIEAIPKGHEKDLTNLADC